MRHHSDPAGINDFTEYGPSHLSVPEVHELGPRVVRTGILDADGNEILRTERMDQIGFVRSEDIEKAKK